MERITINVLIEKYEKDLEILKEKNKNWMCYGNEFNEGRQDTLEDIIDDLKRLSS